MLADGHREVLGVMRIARRDVRLQVVESFSGIVDLFRQIAKLPADALLLVEVTVC